MPDGDQQRPLLIFPEPSTSLPPRRGGGGGRLTRPSAAEQRRRLNAKFQTILNSLQSVQTNVQGLEPEQVIVLETIGESVEGLTRAAQQVPGLEWLAELDLEDVDPDFGFGDEASPDKKLPCRLYAVMSNQQAMQQLVSLWGDWCADPTKRARPNFGPFKNIFVHLKDVRRWSVEDRLTETGLIDRWKEDVEHGLDPVRFEIDLWCRASSTRRQQAYEHLVSILRDAGGRSISQAAVPEILYHGVLAELPAQAVTETLDRILRQDYSHLLRCEDVMFFRPFGQARFPVAEGEEEMAGLPHPSSEHVEAVGDPVVALLDGLPLVRHVALDGRLVLDDPEDHQQAYQAGQQLHGTAMSSQIIHGDLSAPRPALRCPIYTRPILVPWVDFDGKVYEVTPDGQLLVDLIHRAVMRIVDGDEAVAPSVKIINLSFGNSFQPFDRNLSPLARLLDWLAWKYKLLFLISVGNQSQDIDVSVSPPEWDALDADQRMKAALGAIRRDQVRRRPFSPAESINAVTVGAMHEDAATYAGGDTRVDLLAGQALPSPIGTVANGFNRSIKPEVLFPGGRQLYRRSVNAPNDSTRFTIVDSPRSPGICVATPGRRPMELDRTAFSCGTSNATALASRCSALIHDRLATLGDDRLSDDHIAVVLKTLLVHGAVWGDSAELLQTVFDQDIQSNYDSHRAWRAMLRLQSRFLGYGRVEEERSLFATSQRVVLLGWHELGDGDAHVYELPLPPSLSGRPGMRRLVATLAWLTPVNPRHKDYRQAYLWYRLPEDRLAVGRAGLDTNATSRGTVQHRILEGEQATVFSDGDTMPITVSCKAYAGHLTEPVPYALAVTLEVADPIDIYTEVRGRIRPVVEIDAPSS